VITSVCRRSDNARGCDPFDVPAGGPNWMRLAGAGVAVAESMVAPGPADGPPARTSAKRSGPDADLLRPMAIFISGKSCC
jgi:hypothetical protein